MSTFGCHNCGVDISKYPKYEESPCATCRLNKETYYAHPVEMFESMETAEDAGELENITNREDPLAGIDYDLNTLNLMKQVCEEQFLRVASSIIIKMIALAKRHPVMIEVVLKKLQYPHMSYSEIGASLTRPCLKQNILHHLKMAVKLFPEISHALITDTRSNGGHYALRTVAADEKEKFAKNRLKQIIYGNDPDMQAMTLKEINAVFKVPKGDEINIPDFDLYTRFDNNDDEDKDYGDTGDKD